MKEYSPEELVSKFRVNAETILRFNLRPAGGAAVRLVPEQVKEKSVKDYKKRTVL